LPPARAVADFEVDDAHLHALAQLAYEGIVEDLSTTAAARP